MCLSVCFFVPYARSVLSRFVTIFGMHPYIFQMVMGRLASAARARRLTLLAPSVRRCKTLPIVNVWLAGNGPSAVGTRSEEWQSAIGGAVVCIYVIENVYVSVCSVFISFSGSARNVACGIVIPYKWSWEKLAYAARARGRLSAPKLTGSTDRAP